MIVSWRRIGHLASLVAVLGAFSGLHYAKDRWAFGLNMTKSLPHWAFVVDSRRAPRRGDLVMFAPPANRFYDAPFVKRIVGVAGDRVENRDGRIFVAGELVGVAKTVASDGSPLTAIESIEIPPGHVFVAGEHRDSFDSRYQEIGLVPESRFVGKAAPVL